jgi:hypothetical protein
MSTTVTQPFAVPADQLLTEPRYYIDRYYPLREAEWIVVTQWSVSATVFGTFLGLVLTSAVPMVRQMLTGMPTRREDWVDVAVEATLLLLATTGSRLLDRRKSRTRRRISDWFDKKAG